MDHRRALQAADHRSHHDTSPTPARRDAAEPRVAPVHISFLIDRSGSMQPFRRDVVGGFNGFVAEHRERPHKCALTLVQFDSNAPFEVIHDAVDIQDVPDLTVERYEPRGATPLLDALGRLIEHADASLKRHGREEDQIVVVYSDGHENASRSWSRERLFTAITERKRKGWTFVFLGANQDSYVEARGMGIDDGSVQDYAADRQGHRKAWSSLGRAVREYRDASYDERLRRKKAFFGGRKEAEADHRERFSAGRREAGVDDRDRARRPAGSAPSRNDNRALLRALADDGRLSLRFGEIFERPVPFRAGAVSWNRVRGMMLGLAIGDGLGNTSEGQLPSRRRQRHGEIRDYLPNPHAEGRAVGLPSDDTQLAFWTLEHLVECGGLHVERLARTFASRPIFGIGHAVTEFRERLSTGLPWWEAAAESAGNGALMRIAPITIPHLGTGNPAFWSDVALCAAITHNDPGSIGACVAFAGLLGELLAAGEPPSPVWWASRYVDLARGVEGDDTRYAPRGGESIGYRGPIWRFVQDQVPARAARRESVLDAGNAWYSGAYLLETVPTVLFILTRYGHDAEEAIIRAVNDTKDNDTVAAIVGAAVGALHGEAALPERWRRGLLGRTAAADDDRVREILAGAEAHFGSQRGR